MSDWKARPGTLKACATSAMIGQSISHYEIVEQPGSPDGKSILYSKRDSSGSDIMVIENFRRGCSGVFFTCAQNRGR